MWNSYYPTRSRSPLHIILNTRTHLTRQNLRTHNTENMCINLNTVLFSCRDFCRNPLEDPFSQPRLELIDLSTKEPVHNLRQCVFHHILTPVFQRKIRIQFSQFGNSYRLGSFLRECIINRTDPIDPWILTRLPSFSSVL